MSPIALKLRTWWESADRTQRIVTLGGIAMLIFLLAGTFFFATRPKYSLLYSGMNEADKNTVVTEIQAMGIPVNYDVPGQVEVPANKIGEINMKLAGSGKLPKSAHPGIPDLDKMSLFSTPAQERERLKVILEGELAKSIETLESVQAARVHLTLGDNSPFVQERKPPTASVSINEATGATLTTDQGRAIATLVANACEGMSVQNVTVLNQRMQFVFNGQDIGDERTVAADKLEMENRIAKQREREIQQALDGVFGPGATVVMVRCELDLDKQKLHAVDQRPSEEAVRSEKSTEKMSAPGDASGGPVGTTANAPTGAPITAQATSGKASDYVNKTEVVNRLTSETTTDTEKATGAVKSMTINVIANTDKIQDLTALQQIVNGEVKNRTADPVNFPLPTVTGVKFDTSATDAANRAQSDAASQARMQQLLSLVPIAALVLVAVMVVRQIGKFARPVETAIVADHRGEVAGHYALSNEELMMLPSDAEELQDPDDILAALRRSQEEHDLLNPTLLAEEIKDKVDPPLEALRRMSDDRPQLVGMLIKSMLLEERK